MHTLIERHPIEIALVCRRYGVRRLDVFGSAARGSDLSVGTSDADFQVAFAPTEDLGPLQQFFGLAAALEHPPGRPVDLVEQGENPFPRAAIERAREKRTFCTQPSFEVLANTPIDLAPSQDSVARAER